MMSYSYILKIKHLPDKHHLALVETAVNESAIISFWSRSQTRRGHWNIALVPQSHHLINGRATRTQVPPQTPSAARIIVRSNVIATAHMQSLGHMTGSIPSNAQCRTPYITPYSL